MTDLEDDFELYKKKEGDTIWWLDPKFDDDTVGEFLFTFDKIAVYNLFEDYPDKLTPEEKAIFDRENPQWAEMLGGKA